MRDVSNLTRYGKTWETFYAELQKRVPIPQEEWAYFQTLTAYRTISKNSLFVKAGERTDSIGICAGGVFRLYRYQLERTNIRVFEIIPPIAGKRRQFYFIWD